MISLIPEVKKLCLESGYTRKFDSFQIINEHQGIQYPSRLLDMKLWNYPKLKRGTCPIQLTIKEMICCQTDKELLWKQGYYMTLTENEICIYCMSRDGLVFALSTLKQMIEERDGYCCRQAQIWDWPSIQYRSLSVTFAWYAGYGRFGFDMQLWDFEKWKEFLNICSDYKINQLNLCLYGCWPFDMKVYPESDCKDLKMKVWNEESENWIEVCYMHPNIAEQFLPQLIDYGHQLGISFFAYVGLNSYSGGYANAHREKRMKMPEGGRYINDFDSLCLSQESTIEYLKACMRAIVEQGFDGIDFEESEEAFWYCECSKCRETFWKGANTPEETLHEANTWLLNLLYKELKSLKPDITIGIRAWRQPPLVRSEELIQEMADSIPEDVVLFWAPGQYVDDREFEKWLNIFGKDRIRGRDTEAIGFAAGLGRLIRPFRFNGLRCEEETITQYVEEDIRQHLGSVKMGAAGINGYQFEWYGFFMAFFAHAYYGWGGERDAEDFYQYALKGVFQELAEDIEYVMKHMFTIHETQLGLFELEFPFAANKVEERDIPRIMESIEQYPILLKKLEKIRAGVKAKASISAFELHFKKWEISIRRSRIIYDMAFENLKYEKAETQEEGKRYLERMYLLNEEEMELIRINYFDVNPVSQTGISSCMIPYHELKRVIWNKLHPEKKKEEKIFLGIESLGWMWLS